MTKNIAVYASKEIEEVIRKVESGIFNNPIIELKDSNFGIYYPAMVGDDNKVIPIPDGQRQTESNLEIEVSDEIKANAVKVGWYLKKSDLACAHCSRHGGDTDCVHCEGHKTVGHKNIENSILSSAEQLDPNTFEVEMQKYIQVLNTVGSHGFGLYVLHAHSNEHAFTTLPQDVLSVIVNGKTEFLHRSDVEKVEAFVPNMWRYENGKCQVAGGFM